MVGSDGSARRELLHGSWLKRVVPSKLNQQTATRPLGPLHSGSLIAVLTLRVLLTGALRQGCVLSGLLLALDTSVVAAIPSGNGTVVKVQSQQVNSPNTPPPPPKKRTTTVWHRTRALTVKERE